MERAEREAVSAYAEAQTWFVIANTDSASPRGFALRKSKSFFAPTGVDVESDEFRAVVSDAAERALEESR